MLRFSLLISIGFWLLVPTHGRAEPLATCAEGDGYETLCASAPPEDMELTADGHYLLMSITPGMGGQHVSRLRFLDVARSELSELPLEFAKDSDWGDASCSAPQHVGAHGIHLSQRADGRQQLLVVNHDGREAIEFIELQSGDSGLSATWRGCVENTGLGKFNDVVATADGGFVATVMFESQTMAPPIALPALLDGRDTGYLMAWSPSDPLHQLAGSQAPFPNGIQRSPRSGGLWFSAWTAKQLWRYDLTSQQVTAKVDLEFMPDNLSIDANDQLLAAGIPDAAPFIDCFEAHAHDCEMGVEVARLLEQGEAPQANAVLSLSAGVMSGASVALDVGGALMIGTFAGERMVRVPAFDAGGDDD